jgi:hypothetical protein
MLYDKGCPCFNKNDVTFALALAKANGGCTYSYQQNPDDVNPDSRGWYLTAGGVKDNVVFLDYSVWEDIPGDTGVCRSQNHTSVPDSRSSFVSVENGVFVYLDEAFHGKTSDCQALLDTKRVKRQCG